METLIQCLEEATLSYPSEALQKAAKAYGVSVPEARLILVAEKWSYDRQKKLFIPDEELVLFDQEIESKAVPTFSSLIAEHVITHRINHFTRQERDEFSQGDPPPGWTVGEKKGDPLWRGESGGKESILWFTDQAYHHQAGLQQLIYVEKMESIRHYAQLIALLDIGE
jgi:hypothetical protein